MMAGLLDWNVAVYCANEAARLKGCLESVAAALAGRRALITVILNGSHDGSLEIARAAARAGAPIEIYQIAAADKSNAINQFYYTLRSPARAYAGVDGYVFIGSSSFRAMEERLGADAHAVAVTGVAVNGRTMKLAAEETITVGGRLNGQLHAFRPEFLDRMTARGIKLPVDLYRGDSLLGSMAAHNLDPLSEPWNNARIPGVRMATFEIPVLSPFKPKDLRRQFRRKVRQVRGRLENEAIKLIIYRAGYEALPDDANEMILTFLSTRSVPSELLANRAIQRLAIWQITRARRPDSSNLMPLKVPLI